MEHDGYATEGKRTGAKELGTAGKRWAKTITAAATEQQMQWMQMMMARSTK